MRLIMRLCDRLHVLDHGRTIAVGTPAAVRADPAVLEAYLGRRREMPMLTVADLHVSYGRIRARAGVSLDVDDGEIVGLLGPNGAGKTSCSPRSPASLGRGRGNGRLRRRVARGHPPETIVRRGVTLVPEGRHIFATLTVGENLASGPTVRRDRAGGPPRLERASWSASRCCERYSARPPAGSPAASSSSSPSPGRCSPQPRLLLLDEPSLGLAPLLVDLVFDTLAELRDEGHHRAARRAERRADGRARRPHLRAAQRRGSRRGRRDELHESAATSATAYLGLERGR